ncbi:MULTISPECIES: TraR/DksA C4-type zinc finger protein [Flammeovirga]|uniref:TraR/DksA family transcriptional regulator n=1 Tax=Flammeovirga aprica JL-4 TaxID=694437 RepID=A0A7X9P0P4_9BACT|nr:MULTISPECIES: TraR/DksA C4-type zinc finger protein [Flammeovirga]KXX68831.1 molecular chaperone DnaK [Flammeovirga sp. SJP92]NME67063.1 TraR/DksA family transcriptional regulator [Flammeovirga aprica JL-4]
MAVEKLRYSAEDLKEFEILLNKKLERTNKELDHLKHSITKDTSGQDSNHTGGKTLEDGADAFEKEQLNQLAARTVKYRTQLEKALVRIKNGTYGVCVDTGNLISKERLRAVPHTQHSIEAKLKRS